MILLAALSGDRGGSSSFPLGSPLVADAAGAFGIRVPAPDLASDRDLRERLRITANDQVRARAQPPRSPAEQSGTVQVTLSAWGIAARGSTAAATRGRAAI
ncbi:MAG TPA: hypothetical protein VHF51_19825 [Solirubrobacteraceae bacterium]|nr:hypothetical protein [Solirubrobacteraceae bacterium]